MSKFNTWAKKADAFARENFNKYNVAKEKLKEAEESRNKYDVMMQRYGYAPNAKKALLDAEYEEAKAEYNKVVRELRSSSLSEIRKQLEDDIDASYIVDLDEIDSKAMEVMKSGLMKASDYNKYLADALKEENHTMVKVIGKYVDQSYRERVEKYGDSDPEAKALSYLKNTCSKDDGREYLDTFSVLEDVYNRSVKNPSMMSYWDQLTAEIVEDF